MPWHTMARRIASDLGLDPRYLRRLRWISKSHAVMSEGAPLRKNLGFILTDPELANFTYELANEGELTDWIATVSRTEHERAHCLVEEARTDTVLARRVRNATAGRWWWTKASPPFGKRLAWYAFIRTIKPQVVVETGVHDGLGSLVLLRALERNAEEGAAGRLISFDVKPTTGWIVGEHPLWEFRLESSRTGLATVLAGQPRVGMFIHDSLHTYDLERYELETAARHLAPAGLLLTDDAQITGALADLSRELGWRYYEFHERPVRHFSQGGALGAARR